LQCPATALPQSKRNISRTPISYRIFARDGVVLFLIPPGILVCGGHDTTLIWYNGRVGCNTWKRTLQGHVVAPHSAFGDAFRREQEQCSMKLRHVTKRSQWLPGELGRGNMNMGRRRKHSSARERSAMFLHPQEGRGGRGDSRIRETCPVHSSEM
jgi:hypothetical protein